MRILVVGSQYGLGQHVAEFVDCAGEEVVRSQFDVRDADAISLFLDANGVFDGLAYCAGVNKINPFGDALEKDFWHSMEVNCYGFIRLLRLMRDMGKTAPGMRACLVTSNAANVAMRHSLSYNCSKAAANMAIKQMAREIHPDEQMIYAVAPNKLEGTPMSKIIEARVCRMRGWTPEEAHQYQVDALPARKETDVDSLACFIHETLTGPYYPYIHGNILPFGGPV